MKIIKDGLTYLLANKNGKWGLINYYDGSVVVPFEYNTLEAVPTDKLFNK